MSKSSLLTFFIFILVILCSLGRYSKKKKIVCAGGRGVGVKRTNRNVLPSGPLRGYYYLSKIFLFVSVLVHFVKRKKRFNEILSGKNETPKNGLHAVLPYHFQVPSFFK